VSSAMALQTQAALRTFFKTNHAWHDTHDWLFLQKCSST